MTEIGEKVAIPGVSMDEQDKKKVKCDWKDCQTTHDKKPKYPKGGTVKRNNSYKTDWVNAKLEPWEADMYGPGKDSKASLQDYRKETPAASYAPAAAAMKHPKYHTQKHHLISINLFGGYKKLSHDAELIGYDVNHKNNGICLPSYIVDIVRHDLQCHRSGHKDELYNDKIKPLLKKLQDRCVKYCIMDSKGTGEHQAKLMEDLNRISRRVERKILDWKWLVRSNAHAERKSSKERYKTLD